jgi:PAS domain-containing protein
LARAVLDSDPNYRLIFCVRTPAWSQPSTACAMPWGLTASRNNILITNFNLPYNYITYVNPGVERTTGYPPGETIGKNCLLLGGGYSGLRRREQTKK